MRCVSVVAPHSRFRGPEAVLDTEIGGHGAAPIELPIRVDGAPGDEIENAFLILVVARGDVRWRHLARLRVRIDDGGTPRPTVEAMTSQRVGFSAEP